jgi:hypothetical protein
MTSRDLTFVHRRYHCTTFVSCSDYRGDVWMRCCIRRNKSCISSRISPISLRPSNRSIDSSQQSLNHRRDYCVLSSFDLGSLLMLFSRNMVIGTRLRRQMCLRILRQTRGTSLSESFATHYLIRHSLIFPRGNGAKGKGQLDIMELFALSFSNRFCKTSAHCLFHTFNNN